MTAMWERFSFYGIRALLVYYLIAGGPHAKPAARAAGKGVLWTLAAAGFHAVAVATGSYTLTWALVPITLLGLVIPAAVPVRIN